MPYTSISHLTDPIKKHLPKHAQEIYKKAFNHAYEEYSDPSKRRSGTSFEETCHRVAWNAVKKKSKMNQVNV